MIIKGELQAGELLPSIELAKDLRVSVLQLKGYEELEKEGL